jgi:hypothetical protein
MEATEANVIGLLHKLYSLFEYIQRNPEQYQDESGGWRQRVYQSGLVGFATSIMPFFDINCPNGWKYQAGEVIRALFYLMAWWTLVIRNLLDVPGVYPSF